MSDFGSRTGGGSSTPTSPWALAPSPGSSAKTARGKSSLIDALSFVADVVQSAGYARRGDLRGLPDDPALIPFADLVRDAGLPFVIENDSLVRPRTV